MGFLGTHWIANLFDCQEKIKKEDENALIQSVRYEIEKVGFKIVGFSHYAFEPEGLTFVFLLSESHVSIHTWPEKKVVALDVYGCNHSSDNAVLVERLGIQIGQLFKPKKISSQLIKRDEI